MIDFRYHLVSLIAVFLAVALGIVIGTTQLNGPVLDDLRAQVSNLQDDKRNLESTAQELRAQVDTDDAFEEAVGPALVADALTGRSVVLVLAAEDVDADVVEAVTALVGEADGTVTGALQLHPEFSDPSSAAALQSYVTGPGRPAGVTLPETDDTGELVGALLGQVLMIPPTEDPEGERAEPDTAELSTVLAGLSALDVISQNSPSVTPADYAILVTAGTVSGDDAQEQLSTLVELALGLDVAGSGAVVAGDLASAGDNGLVGVVRADPEISAEISTVDNVDGPAGQISAVLALSQEGQGTSGKYGTAEGTQPVPPVPTPTP